MNYERRSVGRWEGYGARATGMVLMVCRAFSRGRWLGGAVFFTTHTHTYSATKLCCGQNMQGRQVRVVDQPVACSKKQHTVTIYVSHGLKENHPKGYSMCQQKHGGGRGRHFLTPATAFSLAATNALPKVTSSLPPSLTGKCFHQNAMDEGSQLPMVVKHVLEPKTTTDHYIFALAFLQKETGEKVHAVQRQREPLPFSIRE